MAISNTTPNIIKASDILNLENNSINTGKITCSSIECTGQITGGSYKRKTTETNLLTVEISTSNDVTYPLSKSYNYFETIIIFLRGFGFPVLSFPVKALQFTNTDNKIYFESSSHPDVWKASLYFPTDTSVYILSNTTGSMPLLQIWGINYFA